MRCKKHNKDITAVCQWCGAELCKLCISKTDGKKAYCFSCSKMVGDFLQKKQIEKIHEEEERERRNTSSSEYFNFGALKQP